jgi:hypothetical protein
MPKNPYTYERKFWEETQEGDKIKVRWSAKKIDINHTST